MTWFKVMLIFIVIWFIDGIFCLVFDDEVNEVMCLLIAYICVWAAKEDA